MMTSYPTRHRPYKIIYNADTSWGMQNARNKEEYLLGVVGFLETVNVDALFWHDGSGGNNAYYDSEVMELNGERIGKVEPLLRRLIDDGDDPPAIVIEAAREQGVDVFYSFRINDCHDSLGDGESHPQLLASFKLEHPEWLIGGGHPYGGCNQLNFAIPEVCELKFAIIEEAARKYDFDGIEIDFQRGAPFFIPGTELDNAHILTGFVRRVHLLLKERGAARGRPFPLAVRVPESLEACRLDGFDVGAWIGEGLVDMVALGSGAIDIEVKAVRSLAEGTDVRVYACLYGWPSGYGPFTSEMCRALAANYWHQGADGIYAFNWNAHTYTQRPEAEPHRKFGHQMELLRQIHDPQKLRGADKRFPADRVGGSSWAYPHNWVHCVLPAKLDATERPAVVVPIILGEDMSGEPPASVQLHVELAEPQPVDAAIGVALNGNALQSMEQVGSTIIFRLEVADLATGRNEVRVAIDDGTALVNKMWVDIRYAI
jgi:hypothetical protein